MTSRISVDCERGFCARGGRRCRHIYFDEITCVQCCRLDYASRHLHRLVPGIRRVMRLRRIVGLGPPFSPIPKRQPRYKRYARLVARILLEESRLVNVLGRVNHERDRRARPRGMLPKVQPAAVKSSQRRCIRYTIWYSAREQPVKTIACDSARARGNGGLKSADVKKFKGVGGSAILTGFDWTVSTHCVEGQSTRRFLKFQATSPLPTEHLVLL
jgi:hypothetical protein